MNIEGIAKVCHEANKAYCEALGDFSQKSWDEAEDWQRESAVKGVAFTLFTSNPSPSAQHDAWMEEKERNGWKFGPIKDANKKEHPCMVPYEQLPLEQRTKDCLFRAIVTAFLDADVHEIPTKKVQKEEK